MYLFLLSILWSLSVYASPALALNEEASTLLNSVYEKGRAATHEELMAILIAIAKDDTSSVEKRVEEMFDVIRLSGRRLSDSEHSKAIDDAFKNSKLLKGEAYIKANPGLNPKTKEAIKNGSILIGMTGEEVKASWGPPQRIKKTITKKGTQEQWIYTQQFLYFEGGRLATIQTEE